MTVDDTELRVTLRKGNSDDVRQFEITRADGGTCWVTLTRQAGCLVTDIVRTAEEAAAVKEEYQLEIAELKADGWREEV